MDSLPGHSSGHTTGPSRGALPAAPLDPRLVRLCIGVRALVALGAIVLAALPFLFWLKPSFVRTWVAQMSSLPDSAVQPIALSPWLGMLATMLPVGLGLAALWQLWRLFGGYKAGRALTRGAQRHLRRFALVLLALAICEPIYRAVISVVFSLGNPPGERLLIVSLSSHDYLQGLLALVLLAVATVMNDAVRAVEENNAFV